MDRFAAIAHERRAIAELLESLDDEQWSMPSCCGDWTIEDVAAHLTVVWNYTALDYFGRSIRNRSTWFRPRLSLSAINAATVDERKATGRRSLVTELRDHAEDRSTPTGFGAQARLTDVVVHRRDIELSLDIDARDRPEHARAALDAATSRRFGLFSNRRLLGGLTLRATDIDWRCGTGPEVSGPARPLAHALWGRPQSLGSLDGDGVATLRDRFSARR